MRSLLLAAMLLASVVVAAQENSALTEPTKIERLINHIESLQDAKFIRNGTAYDAKTAGQFLKAKWQSQQSEIKTAQDFIAKIASKSSTTGQPYLIKHADGREVQSGEYLTGELRKLEAKP